MNPDVAAAFARSNMGLGTAPLPKDFGAIASVARALVPQYSETVTEVSAAGIHKTPDGSRLGAIEGWLFLFPSHFAFVQEKGLLGRRLEASGAAYTEFKGASPEGQEYGTERKAGEFALQLYGASMIPISRLSWGWFRKGFNGTEVMLAAATERDRVHTALRAMTGW